MTKKQFDRAVQEVKLHNRIHHPDQHHNDPYRRYFDSDHQVNGLPDAMQCLWLLLLGVGRGGRGTIGVT